jgi:predicted MFS family arabinose efflux permease
LLQFSFAVFIKPLSEAFESSRASISAALLVGFVATGLCTPMAGKLIDKHGVRAVVLPGIILFALSIAALGLVPASPVPFVIMFGIAGIFAAGQSPLPYAKAVSGAFERRRGLALGISMSGVGIGAAVVPQIANAMIANYGWRTAFFCLGAIVFIGAFPLVFALLKEPVPVAVLDRQTIPGLTAKEAFRTKQFWFLAFVFFAVVSACAGTIAHIVSILTDRGISPQVATGAISAMGISLIFGRLLTGYLLDRFFAPYVALGFILIPLAGVALLLYPGSAAVAVAAAVCIGIGLGAEVDLIAYMLSRYFGMRSFGEIYGYLFAVFMFGSGIGPFLMGLSFSRTGSYATTLVGLAIALVISSVLVLLVGPYRYPVLGKSEPH